MSKLQEQFEDETGMVAFGRGIDCKIYSDAYVEWLEAKAGQHETVVKYPKHNSTEMINYLLVNALRSLDKEKRHVLTKNLVARDELWKD